MIHETNEIYSKEYTTTVDSKKITKEASKNTDKCINLLKKADNILIKHVQIILDRKTPGYERQTLQHNIKRNKDKYLNFFFIFELFTLAR